MNIEITNAERAAVGFLFGVSDGWTGPDPEHVMCLGEVAERLDVLSLGIHGSEWSVPRDFAFADTKIVDLSTDALRVLAVRMAQIPVPPMLGPSKVSLLRKIKLMIQPPPPEAPPS
jgi:hypothetical protein